MQTVTPSDNGKTQNESQSNFKIMISAMKKCLAELRYRLELFKWKRRVHRRHKPRVRIGHLQHFFQRLDELEIPYAVLRYPEEIPLTPEQEKAYTGDIDIMVDSRYLEQFCRVVSEHPGKIKVDMYSEGIRLGSGYTRMPYYPPTLAAELLATRERHANGFFTVGGIPGVLSLIYHQVYHKGLLSALPSGVAELPPASESDPHNIAETLQKMASSAGITLPENLTLLSLHKFLTEHDWSMPYDLLCRWRKRNDWHEYLQKLMTDELRSMQGNLRNIIVFLIRRDAVKLGADTAIISGITEKFTIIDTIKLNEAAQARVLRQTRGGDWTKHKSHLIVPPEIAVICYDPAPRVPDAGDKMANKHFNVTNMNVFFKHELRERLARMYPENSTNFMHSSDNDLESCAYIYAVYGNDGFLEKRLQLENLISSMPKS